MADNPAIIVKFKTQANQLASANRLNELVGQAAERVEPVFPGDDSDELGAVFEVRLNNFANSQRILHELETLDEIEYAHEPAKRKPI